ncbi:MAG: site-specific DNA-methyltransferase [Candidatus Glassbacteria bacterium]
MLDISAKFDKAADVVLYPGDILDLLPDIPDEFVKLIVTSPPYNIGKLYESKLAIKEYVEQQRKVIKECVRVLNKSGSICWQVGNYVDNGEIIPLDVLLFPLFAELNLKLRNRIIWHFGHGLHARKRFSGRYEVILWFTKNENYTFNLDRVRVPQKYPEKKHFKGPRKGELSGNPLGKNPGDFWSFDLEDSDIWEIPNVKSNHIEKTDHPCQFPVELVERLVLALSDPGDWILDPFMGAGSTAIAALIHQRRVMGAEIAGEYVKLTKERIRLAENGELKIRPLNRKVYDPRKPDNIPPKLISLKKASQESLFKESVSGFERKQILSQGEKRESLA